MIKEHTRMALSSLRAARLRSTMTMFGIIISVASVVTIVGLGNGLQQQVSKQISKLGSNLIIVQPGKRDNSGAVNIKSLQSIGEVGAGLLSEEDLAAVAKVAKINKVSPIATLSGLPTYEGKKMQSAVIVGATEALPVILDKNVEYGSYFTKGEESRNYAVIGRGVAEDLFSENVPIGKTFQIRGQEFIVQGVFEQTPLTPLSPSLNFNNAIVIPYPRAKEIAGGTLQISQILVTTSSAEEIAGVASAIKNALLVNHGGQENFSVLRQEETLEISNGVFDQLTMFISGVAIISLLVGSIGITNIMFASVSERTREIGIRKAVGATNRQITNQFITEAVALSTTGGLVGVVVSLLAIAAIRSTTSLEPIIVLPAIGVSLAVSVGVGIISGILPAFKAAQKDPIDSLRGI